MNWELEWEAVGYEGGGNPLLRGGCVVCALRKGLGARYLLLASRRLGRERYRRQVLSNNALYPIVQCLCGHRHLAVIPVERGGSSVVGEGQAEDLGSDRSQTLQGWESGEVFCFKDK
ncbi:hypothetical protein B0H19DRAFT_1081798 [Mycena capillaripes]|nr:hypothetical protein B0H19DRAFT_1081798 [Mycena capillaripes]